MRLNVCRTAGTIAAVTLAFVTGGGCGPGDSASDGSRPDVNQRTTTRHDASPEDEANKMDESTTDERQEAGDPYTETRRDMVRWQLQRRDISDERVLEAMRRVPRHRFVPESQREAAYGDHALPIGHGQTISQPYIVALMTQLSRCGPDSKVLDVGTGSGYQAAVLAELVDKVYSIEIVEPLASEARERLSDLGYENVEVRHGDGYHGWPEHAPFDAIITAAAPGRVPQPLVDQLAVGGRLVIPIGRGYQELVVIEKRSGGKTSRRTVLPVAFVPMTGTAENGDR